MAQQAGSAVGGRLVTLEQGVASSSIRNKQDGEGSHGAPSIPLEGWTYHEAIILLWPPYYIPHTTY